MKPLGFINAGNNLDFLKEDSKSQSSNKSIYSGTLLSGLLYYIAETLCL